MEIVLYSDSKRFLYIVCFHSIELLLHQKSFSCFVLVSFNRSLYLTIRVSTSRRYHRSDSEVVTMLRFKTNTQTSAPFGIEAGTQRVKFQDLRTDSSVWSPCLSNH